MKDRKFVKFVIHYPRTALWQFRAKYHDENGDLQKLVVGEHNGKEKLALINFPAGKRIITIPANKKDINGRSFAEFLRNSPYCKGSSICEGEGIFYEYDPIRDAKVANEEARERLKAELFAMELEGDELKSMAAYCGCFDEDEDVQRSVVMEYAKLQFRKFNDKAGTPEVTNTAIFKTAENAGYIKKRGFMYEADINGERIQLGNNEQKAIAMIASEKELRNALLSLVEDKKLENG